MDENKIYIIRIFGRMNKKRIINQFYTKKIPDYKNFSELEGSKINISLIKQLSYF